jgi:glycosyltransferase involved in cell wall biosynthesis
VLAEALACGVPVVALEGPGVRDTVRDGIDGIVVPRDPEAGAADRLASALVTLASDKKRREEMALSAGQVASRFALQRRVGEVVELYREALASP